MLRKIFAIFLSTFAVSAAIYASGNAAQLDAFAYSETLSLTDDGTAEVPVVSQAEITKYSHTENAIRIYWNKAEGANGYDIYRQNVSDKEKEEKWDHIARIIDEGDNGYTIYRYNASTNELEETESVSGTSDYNYRDDIGLSSGTVYTYKVTTFADTDGEITYGAESEPFSAATGPETPVITKYSHTENAIRIYWDKIDSASGYEIYRYNSSIKQWVLIDTIDNNTTLNYRDDGLYSCTVYKYKVRAYTELEDITVHGISSQKFAAATGPTTSKITKFSHTENAIRIYWNKVSGASGYDIFRYNNSSKKWVKIKTINGNATFNYRDDRLSSCTLYQYKVRAYAKCGSITVHGFSSDKFDAPTGPATSKITKFNHINNAVRIFWNKVPGASGYDIFRYDTSTKKWIKVGTVKDNTTLNYRNNGLSSGTVYKYKVRAYAKCGNITVHGISSEKFAAVTNPAATSITGCKRNVNGKTAILSWKKVQCSGYYIQQKKNGVWKTVNTVASPNTLSATLTNLEKNKYMYFRIVPYVKLGSTIIKGKASATYSLILPYTVATIRGSVVKSSASWSSKTLFSFNSGTKFYKLGTSGNWVKVEYNGTIGYVYNKAFTNKANYSSITVSSLPSVADDWLFDNGTGIKTIFDYASVMYYTTAPKLSIEEMVVRGMKLRNGACYYYASLVYYLLDRAGYEVIIVEGKSSPQSEHWWNMVKTSQGWRHYDATPFNSHQRLYGTTDRQTAQYYTWDRTKYPAAQ